MKKSLLVIGLALTAFAASTVFAQDRAGTNAAPELQIPVGAKYTATAGADNAFVTGVDAIYWNPAGLDMEKSVGGALFSYRQYIAGMSISYLAVGSRFGNFGSLALSLRSFNIGTIDVTTENQPDGNGQQIKPTFFIGGLTYSRKLTDRISVGATANLIEESFGNVSASAVGFDFGVQYEDLVGIPGLGLGVAVKNVGTEMQYHGSGMYVQATIPNAGIGLSYYEVQAASFQLPSTIDIGLGYKKPLDANNSLQVMGDFENNNFGIDEYRGGVEYDYMNSFAIRAGYLFSQTGAALSSNAGTVALDEGWSFGAGIDLKKMTGLGLAFDYAYVPERYFGANSLFDIHIAF